MPGWNLGSLLGDGREVMVHLLRAMPASLDVATWLPCHPALGPVPCFAERVQIFNPEGFLYLIDFVVDLPVGLQVNNLVSVGVSVGGLGLLLADPLTENGLYYTDVADGLRIRMPILIQNRT